MNRYAYWFVPLMCLATPLASAATFCSGADRVLFSCPLAKSSKIVSMCAAGPVGSPTHFYYAFGRKGAPELFFSSRETRDNPFRQTHLTYAGATGGLAYSFVRGGFKYVVYSISGTGLATGGLLVQHTGQRNASVDMECKPGSISQPADGRSADTDGWLQDPDINAHGLPYKK